MFLSARAEEEWARKAKELSAARAAKDAVAAAERKRSDEALKAARARHVALREQMRAAQEDEWAQQAKALSAARAEANRVAAEKRKHAAAAAAAAASASKDDRPAAEAEAARASAEAEEAVAAAAVLEMETEAASAAQAALVAEFELQDPSLPETSSNREATAVASWKAKEDAWLKRARDLAKARAEHDRKSAAFAKAEDEKMAASKEQLLAAWAAQKQAESPAAEEPTKAQKGQSESGRFLFFLA